MSAPFRKSQHASRRTRGFTLVEMLVAMVAGLAVALSVIALAKDATTTFHQEVRASSAEMSLRLAAARLSADLEHAAYMSTGNMYCDPQVARPAGQTLGAVYANVGLVNLAGLRLYSQGSLAATVPYSTDNGLAPDQIDISGNMTTSDEYIGSLLAGQSACSGGGDRIVLNTDDPAVMRLAPGILVGAPTASDGQNVQNAFIPIAGFNFMVRITDPTGKYYHYAPTCGAGLAAGALYIDLVKQGTFTGVLTGSQTGASGGGVDGFGPITINPVQTVRWVLQHNADILDQATQVSLSNARFELTREWIDVDGNVASAEIISEFAVDMKFGFTVQNSTTNAVTSIGLDDANPLVGLNAVWAGAVAGTACTQPGTNTPLPGDQGPHRIRGVMFRIATRSALADRDINIPSPANYRYRYCLNGAACTQAARVRTVVSETALLNQGRIFY